MLNLPLVLHIGYHKTGTTYLQRYVFNNHPEILYLGMPLTNQEIKDFFAKFKFIHDLHFDPILLKRDFENILKTILDEYENGTIYNQKIILISREGLHVGPEFFGMDVVNRAKRLSQVFPSAKIIIGIRNQAAYIESFYKQHIKLGGKISFKKFLYESLACNYCLLPKLEYDRIISLYGNLFGDDSVHVYLQEDLKSNPKETLNSLMKFLNVNQNIDFKHAIIKKGLSNLSIHFIRNINKFLAYDYNEQYYQLGGLSNLNSKELIRNKIAGLIETIDGTIFKIISKKRLLGKAEAQYIREYFCESNEKLSILLKRDIRNLGYYY